MRPISSPVKPNDDPVLMNMKNRRYHTALTILKQMSSENSGLIPSNEVRYVQCLYHMKRYRAALEKSRQFVESGNTLPELTFLRGLCAFSLGQWQTAAEFFRTKSEWVRWVKKCELREQNVAPIRIGDWPTKAEDEKIEPTAEQTPRTLLITIPLLGADPNDLRITAGETWLDLVYDEGQRKVNKSWELFEKVFPQSLQYEVTPMGIKVRLEKVDEGEWPSLSRSDSNPSLPDLSPEYFERLNIPTYTDSDASSMFEQKMLLLREEPVDRSSWFSD
jgi:hypothetical protein